MLCGLIVGRINLVGKKAITVHNTKMPGGRYFENSSVLNYATKYTVVLEGVQDRGKPLFFSRPGMSGFSGPIGVRVEVDGTFSLPFSLGTDLSVGSQMVTVNLSAHQIRNDSYHNRQMALWGIGPAFGSARMKSAYFVSLDDDGVPDPQGNADLQPFAGELRNAVWRISTNLALPTGLVGSAHAWNRDRLQYSEMLCVGADIRVSEGGTSS